MNIVFLDVDGTLTSGVNVWEKIHRYFGVHKQSKIYHDMARRKEITYEKWAKLDVALWKDRRYSELFDAIFPAPLIGEAKAGVSLLKKKFDIVYLVSGGIDILVDDVQRRVGADYSVSNRILHLNNVITGEVDIRVGDSKYDVIRQIADEFGADLSECAAIGDDFNDYEMFENVGYSVAFNWKTEEILDVSTLAVSSSSFIDPVRKLLEILPNSVSTS